MIDNNHLKKAFGTYIEYPRLKDLRNKIIECLELSNLGDQPRCLALEGDPGSGKSTFLEEFLKDYPVQRIPHEGYLIPILYLALDSPITPKMLAEQMLEAVGDPAAQAGSLTQKVKRIIGLIRDCKVKLVILDDFHHLIDSETGKILKKVSECLKVLIKKTRIPFLLVGVKDKVQLILRSNRQLSRLFVKTETLEPFQWNPQDIKSIQLFSYFLTLVEQESGVSLSPSIDRVEMLYRIHYATDGLVGPVMLLMRRAMYLCSKTQSDVIGYDELGEAFDTELAEDRPNKINPFSKKVGIAFIEPPPLPLS